MTPVAYVVIHLAQCAHYLRNEPDAELALECLLEAIAVAPHIEDVDVAARAIQLAEALAVVGVELVSHV